MMHKHIPIPVNAHPLVQRFVQAMNVEKKSFKDLATEIGVSQCTPRCWLKIHNPRIDTFEAALNTLGLELFIRPRRGV